MRQPLCFNSSPPGFQSTCVTNESDFIFLKIVKRKLRMMSASMNLCFANTQVWFSVISNRWHINFQSQCLSSTAEMYSVIFEQRDPEKGLVPNLPASKESCGLKTVRRVVYWTNSDFWHVCVNSPISGRANWQLAWQSTDSRFPSTEESISLLNKA